MTYLPGAFPKPCMRCGARYSREEWEQLHLVGRAPMGETNLEYRDCPCHNTMTVAVLDVEEVRDAG